MKTKTQRFALTSFAIASMAFLLSAAAVDKRAGVASDAPPCMTVSPGVLNFGLRGDDPEQYVYITTSEAWSASTSASWIKINGGSTASGPGKETLTITLGSNIPAGVPWGPCPNSTITVGAIVISGCEGNILVRVNYRNCPCC